MAKAPIAPLFTPKLIDFVSQAGRQLPVQQAVLHAGQPALGEVSDRDDRPTRGPGGRCAPAVAATGGRGRVVRAVADRAGAAGAATGAAMAALVVLRPRRRWPACAAPLYARSIAHTDPFTSNVSGTTVVDGQPVPLLAPSTTGLGLGVTPIGPTWDPAHYFLGADNQGRDVMARLLYGGRSSLLIGVAAALLCCLLATRRSASSPATSAASSTGCWLGCSTSSGPSRSTCSPSASRWCCSPAA